MKFVPRSLKFKVSLYLTIVFWAALIPFIALIVKQQRNDLMNEVSRYVTQISDVVVKSTRYAMMVNKRDVAEKIINDIGRQQGIERVRVLDGDGTIIYSNRVGETGYSVEQDEEPCVHCHRTKEPLEHIPDNKRWRVFEAADGHRSLGTMSVIRNDKSCSSASCHEHKASQKVLGVVDIAYSLDEIDQAINTHIIYLVSFSFGFALLLSVSVGILLHRLIYVPLNDLDAGAKEVSSGEWDHSIPVRSRDEFGRVADSFNHMTTALHEARVEMQQWAQSLESKVAERTQELLEARAAIAQGDKLASVGLLASGIAHELNNPLTGVLTFTSLLREKMPEGSQEAEDLDLVIRETKRCASIIRRLLDFAREKPPVMGWCDLNLLVEETVHFVGRPAALMNIDITTELDPELPPVWGDANLIKQVILNILLNAQQAIEGHGNIIVQSRPCLAKDARQPGAAAVPMAEVAVKDTGCGIPAENVQRIFDPFFTSKEVGKGTGLGLSVSYGIIQAHGGTIEVDSEVGVGSTFRIHLPITAPAEAIEDKAGKEPA